ncbi:hypothetical protein TNCV_4032481 [Trichonephila clavipes]|nr:hypothetical protein TNCV_4032481 [Trichonephila clavipes]
MRTELHPGVPPPTTESNKGGSVPVIWQNQARRLPEVHQNIMLQHQGEDPTGIGGPGCKTAAALETRK